MQSSQPQQTTSPTGDMETFKQPKLPGYRQLTQVEADLMREAKDLAEQVGSFIEKLKMHPKANGPAPAVREELYDSGNKVPIDHVWVDRATTELQFGFMALNRAIAQPTTFG